MLMLGDFTNELMLARVDDHLFALQEVFRAIFLLVSFCFAVLLLRTKPGDPFYSTIMIFHFTGDLP